MLVGLHASDEAAEDGAEGAEAQKLVEKECKEKEQLRAAFTRLGLQPPPTPPLDDDESEATEVGLYKLNPVDP